MVQLPQLINTQHNAISSVSGTSSTNSSSPLVNDVVVVNNQAISHVSSKMDQTIRFEIKKYSEMNKYIQNDIYKKLSYPLTFKFNHHKESSFHSLYMKFCTMLDENLKSALGRELSNKETAFKLIKTGESYAFIDSKIQEQKNNAFEQAKGLRNRERQEQTNKQREDNPDYYYSTRSKVENLAVEENDTPQTNVNHTSEPSLKNQSRSFLEIYEQFNSIQRQPNKFVKQPESQMIIKVLGENHLFDGPSSTKNSVNEFRENLNVAQNVSNKSRKIDSQPSSINQNQLRILSNLYPESDKAVLPEYVKVIDKLKEKVGEEKESTKTSDSHDGNEPQSRSSKDENHSEDNGYVSRSSESESLSSKKSNNSFNFARDLDKTTKDNQSQLDLAMWDQIDLFKLSTQNRSSSATPASNAAHTEQSNTQIPNISNSGDDKNSVLGSVRPTTPYGLSISQSQQPRAQGQNFPPQPFFRQNSLGAPTDKDNVNQTEGHTFRSSSFNNNGNEFFPRSTGRSNWGIFRTQDNGTYKPISQKQNPLQPQALIQNSPWGEHTNGDSGPQMSRPASVASTYSDADTDTDGDVSDYLGYDAEDDTGGSTSGRSTSGRSTSGRSTSGDQTSSGSASARRNSAPDNIYTADTNTNNRIPFNGRLNDAINRILDCESSEEYQALAKDILKLLKNKNSQLSKDLDQWVDSNSNADKNDEAHPKIAAFMSFLEYVKETDINLEDDNLSNIAASFLLGLGKIFDVEDKDRVYKDKKQNIDDFIELEAENPFANTSFDHKQLINNPDSWQRFANISGKPKATVL